MGQITRDKGIPLHVDACVGGFILPFFERLGEDVPVVRPNSDKIFNRKGTSVFKPSSVVKWVY